MNVTLEIRAPISMLEAGEVWVRDDSEMVVGTFIESFNGLSRPTFRPKLGLHSRQSCEIAFALNARIGLPIRM